jgi:hypothetical protein
MLNILLALTLFISSNVLPIERTIADSAVECAAGWDQAGTSVFEFCGSRVSSFELTEEQKFAVVGGTVTHNHPEPGCWVLSQFDMRFAQNLALTEMRAVSKHGNQLRVSIVRHAIAFALISDGIIDQEARKQLALHPDDPDCEYLDATWRVLASRYDFNYEVVEEAG